MKKRNISALDIIGVIILVIIASFFFPKNKEKENKQPLQETKQEYNYDRTQNITTSQVEEERVYVGYGTDYTFTSEKNPAGSECRNYLGLKSNVTMRTCDNGLIIIYVNGVQEKLQMLYFKESDIRDGKVKYPPVKGVNYTTYPAGYTETYSNTKYSDYDDYYDDNRSYYEGEEGRDRHIDEYDEYRHEEAGNYDSYEDRIDKYGEEYEARGFDSYDDYYHDYVDRNSEGLFEDYQEVYGDYSDYGGNYEYADFYDDFYDDHYGEYFDDDGR